MQGELWEDEAPMRLKKLKTKDEDVATAAGWKWNCENIRDLRHEAPRRATAAALPLVDGGLWNTDALRQ
jgi:hypothetical protein